MIARLLLTHLLLLPSVPSRGQDSPSKSKPVIAEPAPLGLSWGMTKAEVKALGVELKDQEDGAIGSNAVARNLPKALADTQIVYLLFGFDDRLWRVFIASKPFENDRYGIAAKARFDELSALLSERYGRSSDFIRSPVDDYLGKPEHFSYSLLKKERYHSRSWTARTVSIELSLASTSMDDIYYTLGYEYGPLAENARKGKAGREKEAL